MEKPDDKSLPLGYAASIQATGRERASVRDPNARSAAAVVIAAAMLGAGALIATALAAIADAMNPVGHYGSSVEFSARICFAAAGALLILGLGRWVSLG